MPFLMAKSRAKPEDGRMNEKVCGGGGGGEGDGDGLNAIDSETMGRMQSTASDEYWSDGISREDGGGRADTDDG